MDGTNLTPQQIKLNELKQLFPEVFAEGKVDWEKLKATLGEDVDFSNERYVLNWAGKSDAFKVLQSPTTKTLVPVKDESVNFDETENIFIEGENLEVLKVLQKSYFGKVKMIYIDPPYNTGNDHFIYPDKFSETKRDYEKRVGDKDEEGYMTKDGMFKKNSKENGQYHSNWLNMMYPRLFLAKNLLKQEGVIFISIDDNEVHNLRMMMNEVFGEENFIGQLIWKSRQNKDNRNITGLSIDHEYVLCYSKINDGRKLKGAVRKTEQYKNPDSDERGDWVSGNMVGLLPEEERPNCHYDLINPSTNINYGKPKMGWRYDKNTMNKLIQEERILWPNDVDGRPRRKVFLKDVSSELPNYTSIIGSKIYTRNGTKEIDDFFGTKLFDFPKPSSLISELVNQGTVFQKNDIVLDFFSGSGTTAQAVLDRNFETNDNCKFICVQLPEKTNEKSTAYNQGYKSIPDITKERIRKVGRIIKEKDLDYKGDIGFKVLKLSDSNFKQWASFSKATDADGKPIDKVKALEEQMKLFVDPVAETATIENMVYELMLKSGKNLNSKIEHKIVTLSGAEVGFYSINEGELVLLLEKAEQKTIDAIIKEKPQKVVALDKLFKDNDQLKTNTVLQMKDAGIEFKTI